MKNIAILLIIFITCSFTITQTKVDVGKVIGIVDGDTVDFLQSNNKTIRIRLDAIDAPEKGMPFYKVSKKYLANLCFGKMVSIEMLKLDRNGRTVARITLPNNIDVSAEMIKAGMAWHYKAYNTETQLAIYEKNAKEKRLGLWADAVVYEPWLIRKMHKKGISTKALFEGKVN